MLSRRHSFEISELEMRKKTLQIARETGFNHREIFKSRILENIQHLFKHIYVKIHNKNVEYTFEHEF